ncbi:mitochondrial membrane protein [Phlyctochytrium planicorne]|nr:mitochondrial membrane protein [Phlyctochytrium planicorne]
MEGLPFAVEAQSPVSAHELEALAEAYNNEKLQGPVRAQTKFDYAWALVRSSQKVHQEEGVKLLHEIYKENPARRRECLYYLSLGNYKLGNYRDGRKYNETLLQMEPRNPQALQLRKLIDEKVRSEGLVGMAIVGAAVATVGVLIAGLVRKS